VSDEDFSEYPESLSEIKASNEWDAKQWTPRDVLLSMLRDIDSGDIETTELIVAYRGTSKEDPDPDAGKAVHYRAATDFTCHSAMGILETVKIMMFLGGHEKI